MGAFLSSGDVQLRLSYGNDMDRQKLSIPDARADCSLSQFKQQAPMATNWL